MLLGQATQSHVEIWSPLFSFSTILVVYMLFSSLCVMCLLIVLLLNSSAQHILEIYLNLLTDVLFGGAVAPSPKSKQNEHRGSGSALLLFHIKMRLFKQLFAHINESIR